jgi:hypothetical protein
MTTHKAFFGDAEREFKLTARLIPELERLTGVGIGALCRRVFAGDFSIADARETIRLGLIGAGTSPIEAQSLVSAYVDARPLGEFYPLAVDILSVLWFGAAKNEAAPQ